MRTPLQTDQLAREEIFRPVRTSHMDQIRAHAARVLSADRPFAELVPAYLEFIKKEEHRVRLKHNSGAGGLEVANHRSDLIDFLLQDVFHRLTGKMPRWTTSFPQGPVALMAVGGYGRRELNPVSDVDIVFLHPDAAPSVVTHWEDGIKVVLEALSLLEVDLGSHSTLSLGGALDLSNKDPKTKTSFLQCRLVAGNKKIYEELRAQFTSRCVRGHEQAYIEWRLADQGRRHGRSGHTVSMQEPNIKNGCGGLRDYQNLLWVSFFKANALSTAELVTRGLLSSGEACRLDRAYDFLLRVRNEMHFLSGGKTCSDVLSLEFQQTVAQRFGFNEGSPLRRIEAFMRAYYLHAREIYNTAERLAEFFSLKPPPRIPRLPGAAWIFGRGSTIKEFEGFHARDRRLYANDSEVFDRDPNQILRAFRLAQEHDLALSPELRQLLRAKASLVRPGLRTTNESRQLFQTILDERGRVGRILRLMHDVDFLGRYLPEFGKITCLLQHDYLQRYTADEHTLICLEKLDELALAGEPESPQGLDGATDEQLRRRREKSSRYRSLYDQLQDPFVLHLALLLHDTGKATAARSAVEASAVFAQRVALRLGLRSARRRTLVFLVDHQHTLMHIAQHRNLEDPSTSAGLAEIVGTQENLDALMLFTWADTLGTDERSWTEWKDALTWELYDATSHQLAGDVTKRPEQKPEQLGKELSARLGPEFGEEITAHLAYMPQHYLRTCDSAEAAADILLIREFLVRRDPTDDPRLALAPALRVIPKPAQGHLEVAIAGWDRQDFLTSIAGAFSLAGLNILAAEICRREDSVALVALRVCDASGGQPRHAYKIEEAQKVLADVLGPEPPDLTALVRRQRPANPRPRSTAQDFPTNVNISNDGHFEFTLIEVRTPDRLGLLFDLLRGIESLGLRLQMSRVSTDRGAASDTFYVLDSNHARITERGRMAEVRAALLKAIGC